MNAPILHDFPDQFETERLLIRAPRASDLQPLYEAMVESEDRLKLWMPWANPLPTIEDVSIRLRQSMAKFILREDLRLHLFRKADGYFVGGSGMHNIEWDVPRLEIGYWVRTSMEGQGYITEAVNGITQFAFQRLNAVRVEIMCDARNTRSAAVAARAGFTLEGRLRQDMRGTDGQLRDTLLYSKLAGE